MDGKKKLEELVARADRREFEDNYAPAQRSIAIGHDTIRSISDAYKALEMENKRLRSAARSVCWFDWSDSDDDACAAIESLRIALKGGSRHEG